MSFSDLLLITLLVFKILCFGTTNTKLLVAPGTKAEIGKVYYHAALRSIHQTEDTVDVFCSGALISFTTVITSATCLSKLR